MMFEDKKEKPSNLKLLAAQKLQDMPIENFIQLYNKEGRLTILHAPKLHKAVEFPFDKLVQILRLNPHSAYFGALKTDLDRNVKNWQQAFQLVVQVIRDQHADQSLEQIPEDEAIDDHAPENQQRPSRESLDRVEPEIEDECEFLLDVPQAEEEKEEKVEHKLIQFNH